MARSCPDVVGRVARTFVVAALLAVLALFGSAPRGWAAGPELPPTLAHVSFGGGDGSSCEQAVVIRDARNTSEGIAAERAWLRATYPGASVKSQALVQQGDGVFERFTLGEAGQSERQVCFDISGFFGVW